MPKNPVDPGGAKCVSIISVLHTDAVLEELWVIAQCHQLFIQHKRMRRIAVIDEGIDVFGLDPLDQRRHILNIQRIGLQDRHFNVGFADFFLKDTDMLQTEQVREMDDGH